MLPPLPEPSPWYPIFELTHGMIAKVAEDREKFLRELFGEGGPLEHVKNDYTIEEYPPEVYTTDEAFDPRSITLGFKWKYKIREKTDEEKEATSSQ